MIVFGFHSDFHGISKGFHMILIGFPKGLSSDSMDFHRFSTEDVDMITNEFSKDYHMILKGSPSDFIAISMDLQ